MGPIPGRTQELLAGLENRRWQLRRVIERLERASRTLAPAADDTQWTGMARSVFDDRMREVRIGLAVTARELHSAVRDTSRAIATLGTRV